MHGPNCLTAEAPGSCLGRLGRVSALTWQASCSPAVLGGAEGSALARRACPRPDGPAPGPAGLPRARQPSPAFKSPAGPGRNAFLHESGVNLRPSPAHTCPALPGLAATLRVCTGTKVLAVSNVLTAPIFPNSRNFETEGDTEIHHGIKSLDPYETYQFGLNFLVSSSVSKLREFEKIRAVNTFETASTCACPLSNNHMPQSCTGMHAASTTSEFRWQILVGIRKFWKIMNFSTLCY